MKKIYLSFVLAAVSAVAISQCDPTSYDWMGAEFGISPDAEAGETFAPGELEVAYSESIFLKVPSNASQVNEMLPDLAVDSILLQDVMFNQESNSYSLGEMGLSLACNNLGLSPDPCTFQGGQLGCGIIEGTPLVPGVFETTINVIVYATVVGQVVPYPFQYTGYTFTVEGGDNVAEITSNVPALLQNVPNPADESTTIRVVAKTAGKGTLEIVNMLGEVVDSRQLNLKVGNNTESVVTSELPSGIYFYRLNSNGHMATLRMIVSH